MSTDRQRAMNLVKGAVEPLLLHSPAYGLLRELVAKRPPETEIKHPDHPNLPGAKLPTRGTPKPSG